MLSNNQSHLDAETATDPSLQADGIGGLGVTGSEAPRKKRGDNMGNTIKNFEKKRRKVHKDSYREIQRIVHNAIMEKVFNTRENEEKDKTLL